MNGWPGALAIIACWLAVLTLVTSGMKHRVRERLRVHGYTEWETAPVPVSYIFCWGRYPERDVRRLHFRL